MDSLEQNVDIVRSNVDHFIQRAQLINNNTQPTAPVNTPTPSVATAGSTSTSRSQQPVSSQSAANSVSTQPQPSHTTAKEPTAGKQKRAGATNANKQDPLHKMVDHLG